MSNLKTNSFPFQISLSNTDLHVQELALNKPRIGSLLLRNMFTSINCVSSSNQSVNVLLLVQVPIIDTAIQSSTEVALISTFALLRARASHRQDDDQSVLNLLLVASCLQSLLACTLLALLLRLSWSFHLENCFPFPLCQGFNQLCILLDVLSNWKKLSVSVFFISDVGSFQAMECGVPGQ